MPESRFRRVGLPLLAALCVTAIYAAGSWSNQFVYDDHEVIENQFPIRHFSDLRTIFTEPHYLNFPYYRPLTRLSFAMQVNANAGPRGFHLLNAALAGALLLAACALLRREALQLGPGAALIAATWFAVHPAVSECVYPAASGRETLLPALLILLATWAYLGRGTAWFLTAMILFAAALLSKEQAAVLPGIFFLADFAGLTQRPTKPARWIIRYLPIAAIIGCYFFVRQWVIGSAAVHLTLFDHPLEPLKSMLYGIQTAVLPFMALRYEPPFEVWFDWRMSVFACVVVGLLIAGVIARGKRARLIGIFWLGWFVLLQLPTAHIVTQEAGYSERYAALAILALPALAAMLLSAASGARLRRAAAIAACTWIAIEACVTFYRGDYYTDDASFSIQWRNTNPNAAGPHDGLGRVAQQRSQWETAIQEYQAALSIEPTDSTARNNLANVYSITGNFPGATQQYEWLLNHNSVGADPVAVMTNYAQLLAQQAFDRHDAAMRDKAHGLLNAALQLRPDYAQAHLILGEWNMAFGSREAAIRQFQIALELRPGWEEAQRLLQATEQSDNSK
jgi:tetratricopeptide (TPR) repeat protein